MAKAKQVPKPEPEEWENPVSGQLFDPTDPELLLEVMDQLNQHSRMVYGFMDKVKARILALTPLPKGEKTAYLLGEKLKAKIVLKSDGFDKKKLGEVKAVYQKLAVDIKPDGYKIGKRDFDRIMKTSGSADFEEYKKALACCVTQATGAPSVTIIPLDAVSEDES